MKLTRILEIYELISQGSEWTAVHHEGVSLRKIALEQLNEGLVKVAFDTRRINQETEYNPRRGLQNYHRSEQFVSTAQAEKLTNLSRLKIILDELKQAYGREPEWQDSYCRVLLNTLNKTLRTDQQDGDFGENQPSVGSLDYVEELLFTRYRLDINSISKFGSDELVDILLRKDEALTRKGMLTPYVEKPKPLMTNSEITKHDVVVQSYDALIDKLFGVYATQENPEIERTVTITIKDKINK